jgi:hypothetical protein
MIGIDMEVTHCIPITNETNDTSKTRKFGNTDNGWKMERLTKKPMTNLSEMGKSKKRIIK